MTSFEKFLLTKGYHKFRLNMKTFIFELELNHHTISSMTNLCYHYFHLQDPIMAKINNGGSINENGISFKDRKNEIIFGLHEIDSPPTLISPKPVMAIKKDGSWDYSHSDDCMNIVLSKIDHETILKAMFDKSMLIKIEL